MDLQNHNYIDWLSHHLLACPFKLYSGIDCPGCGLQRSILALFRGSFLESFKLYPATIPIIFILVFTFIHLKWDFKFGAQLIKIVFSGIAVIILINYIYKISTYQLLN